jgi:hypothetical protein
MTLLRFVAIGTSAIIAGACADAGVALGPTAHTLGAPELATSAARRVETAGTFDAIVDFSTLTLTPRGSNCLLEVEGRLEFSGTIEGTAVGQTSALVFAPCEDVGDLNNPPGTFPDVFKSELDFEGTVDGEPAEAKVLYMGQVEPPGDIEGRLIFSNGVQGQLDVTARVAVGGDYRGSVVVN